MTDHHGKTTTSSAVNVRPPSDTKRCHGTNYCAFAHTSVNRDNVSNVYSTRSSASHYLVDRQTIHLYICPWTYFVYSTQYPTVVILGNKRTHARTHTTKLKESSIGVLEFSFFVGHTLTRPFLHALEEFLRSWAINGIFHSLTRPIVLFHNEVGHLVECNDPIHICLALRSHSKSIWMYSEGK